MSNDNIILPGVHLKIKEAGPTCFYDSGDDWDVWAEVDELHPEPSARTKIQVRGEQVADIRVYLRSGIDKADLAIEVQEISCTILWSRFRAIARREGKEVSVVMQHRPCPYPGTRKA